MVSTQLDHCEASHSEVSPMKANPEVASPLDQLLSEAATGPARRLLPGKAGLRFLHALSKEPVMVAHQVSGLALQLVKVANGTSDIAPVRGDRRFTDGAWMSNPVLKRTMQAYLVTAMAAQDIVRETPLDWSDAERMQFVTMNLVQAMSPSNVPLVNPLAWKALIDSGGTNLYKGTRNLVHDMSSRPRIPTMVAPDAFTVGGDLALTPGAVVHRSPLFEIIQYAPQTATVRETPILVIPPTINKYYVLDLAPGRSLMEYLVAEGQHVFMLSWRNPDERHREWGFDSYTQAVDEALDVVLSIAGATSTHVMAACSGGILACLAAARRAVTDGTDHLASLSLLVTMIDQQRAGTASALTTETVIRSAIAKSQRKGYLDGRSLAEIFAWLRPSDLIWNYWVNNYLEGKTPPKFDILYWNADTTRMPAALHRDFLEASAGNKFAIPDAVKVLGTPIDLSTINVDSYVVAGSADHICPWANCYRSAQLLGGRTRFVLSTNGHIAALVNPPSNPKSSFRVFDDVTPEPAQWREKAELVSGSWWPDYLAWLTERSGEEVAAPEALGNEEYPPSENAPGTYVFDT